MLSEKKANPQKVDNVESVYLHSLNGQWKLRIVQQLPKIKVRVGECVSVTIIGQRGISMMIQIFCICTKSVFISYICYCTIVFQVLFLKKLDKYHRGSPFFLIIHKSIIISKFQKIIKILSLLPLYSVNDLNRPPKYTNEIILDFLLSPLAPSLHLIHHQTTCGSQVSMLPRFCHPALSLSKPFFSSLPTIT